MSSSNRSRYRGRSAAVRGPSTWTALHAPSSSAPGKRVTSLSSRRGGEGRRGRAGAARAGGGRGGGEGAPGRRGPGGAGGAARAQALTFSLSVQSLTPRRRRVDTLGRIFALSVQSPAFGEGGVDTLANPVRRPMGGGGGAAAEGGGGGA